MLLSLIIRGSKFIIGLAFVGVLMWALLWTVVDLVNEPPKPTAEEEFHEHHLKDAKLASEGPLGRFDVAQLQRGMKVYRDVCANCHSMSLVSFREFADLGYNEAQVKKIAADWPRKTPTFDTRTGDRGERPNLLSDKLPMVFYPGKGTPPDLTLIAKARHGGGNYLYSLLTGYQPQPKELLEKFPDAKTPDGLFYNPYFPNLNLSMPAPLLAEGQVEYTDGTRATVDQMAKDVSAFLVWAAEPTAQSRKAVGWAVLGFLLLTTLLAFGAYRSVWHGTKH